MRARLIPVDGDSPPIDVLKDLTLVGRREDCDVHLDHKSVSKLHCVIVKTDGLLLLRDLGSTNGTRVNGQRVRRAALLPNDKLSIANYAFRVIFGGAEPAVAPEDRTQQLNANKLSHQPDELNVEDSVEENVLPIQQELPDVYPDESSKDH